MGDMVERAQIIVRGIVQGVGFRPYVYSLADGLGLKGFVTNTADGVLIDIEGQRLAAFIERLPKEAPSLSRITDLSITPLPNKGYPDFTIRKSTDRAETGPFTLISPDVSICDDCSKELLDTRDRRYLYPFINCTNCGPRYSITRSIPYDRPNTTMAGFTMCPECLSEYNDPKNRRFHAQPNACGTCGPQVEFKVLGSEFGVIMEQADRVGVNETATRLPRSKIEGGEALIACVNLLRQGGIIAIKGLGGFHIACDATNDEAVRRLRANKRKSNKPFAVMAPSVEAVEQFCAVSAAERDLLVSSRRPIVLLRKRHNTAHLAAISGSVAPNNQYIGCMLPYTPLHYLLFHYPITVMLGDRDRSHFQALVMTSGNLSEEPIIHDNDEAIRKLSGIVDAFLLHDRDIFMRVDDSVVRLSSIVPRPSSFSFLRRSRGYSPEPIDLHGDGPEVLGCGADLKNTFTLTKGSCAIPSQHIGDMENHETLKCFEESLENLKSVYRVNPIAIVHDLHPGYMTTRWGMGQVEMREEGRWTTDEGRKMQSSIRLYGIQHHYAHIGSVMAENGLRNKVIGVAFDGTGYGADGNLWGGEFLIADIDGFERVGQFKYIPLPGGQAAIREPWKMAVSYVLDAARENASRYLEQAGFIKKYGRVPVEQVMTIARSRELSPLSSGAGRLFDAVSALMGICEVNTFEGEAAMALESFVQEGVPDEYPVEFDTENEYTVIDFSRTMLEIIKDFAGNTDRRFISTRFHNTVAAAIKTVVCKVSKRQGIPDVALSGGTFQNLYLLNRTVRLLKSEGMNVFFNQKVPSNDAGISLGQAYIVRERIKHGL
jgi:hydrogenase maturation protein HypF